MDHPAPDSARPSAMADLPYFSEALALNPMLANPAAAMAAATAIGFGFANQMATAFFGAWQNALETTSRQTGAPSAVQPEQPASEVVASAQAEEMLAAGAAATAAPLPAAVELKLKPVRKPPVAKAPAAAKPAAEKKVAAETAKVAAPVKAKPAAKKEIKAPAKSKAPAKVSVKVAVDADDLKQISGIGPKLEGILKDMGVTSLAQVAAWVDKDIARFDKELGFEGRIKRDDWVGQAKALLK